MHRQKVGIARALLRLHVGFSGRHVGRKGNMRVNDLPAALLLAPHVGYPKNHIERFAAFVSRNEVLNAFSDAELSIGSHIHIDKSVLGALAGSTELKKFWKSVRTAAGPSYS